MVIFVLGRWCKSYRWWIFRANGPGQVDYLLARTADFVILKKFT